eukprot:PITA_27234
MVDEMASLHKNKVWELMELPAGRKPIGSKWVFKKKTNAEGKVKKYNARLLEKEQMDVKTTFLHGDMEGEIYMKQPEGFAVKVYQDTRRGRGYVHVPYASVVDNLMYVMDCTRPDIADVVGVLSRFMSKPGKEHCTVVKQVFRYLCGTSDYILCYQGRPRLDRVLDIRVIADADWAEDLDQRRSTSGYVLKLFGGVVSWMINKQSVVAKSTTEAKYMVSNHASKEVVWL